MRFIQFAPNAGIKCYAVLSGACWLAVEGVADAAHLQAGDCFVLPSGPPFRLASDLTLPPVDAAATFPAVREGGIVCHNGDQAIPRFARLKAPATVRTVRAPDRRSTGSAAGARRCGS